MMISCNNEITQQLEPKGVALGKMNEIVVIADQDLWESAVGDTFKYYFQSAYPILPSPEPLFDIRHFTYQDLVAQPLRKELRAYTILADLSDDESPVTQMVKKDMGEEKFASAKTTGGQNSSVGKDKWARGQVLFYLFGAGHDKISESIKKHYAAVARRVNQHDEKQLKSSIYVDRINKGLSIKIKNNYGLDIEIPGEYQVAIDNKEDNLMWLRKDTDDAILNIVVRSIPYTNQNQLTKANMIKIRNDFGSKYITSDEEGDAMVVNETDLPVYEYTFELDGKYTKEIRGVWEMTKSFAGGPFSSYLVVDDIAQKLIFVDVFVLAPGKTKRNMMMQLDYIIKSGKVIDTTEME
jgi:hypothetical protein